MLGAISRARDVFRRRRRRASAFSIEREAPRRAAARGVWDARSGGPPPPSLTRRSLSSLFLSLARAEHRATVDKAAADARLAEIALKLSSKRLSYRQWHSAILVARERALRESLGHKERELARRDDDAARDALRRACVRFASAAARQRLSLIHI